MFGHRRPPFGPFRRPLAGWVLPLLALAACGDGVTGAPAAPATRFELASGGDLSPLCGQAIEGGLRAEVPLRGVISTPGDHLTAMVFDFSADDYVTIGEVYADPVPLAMVDGEAVYAFDFGTACALDTCDAQLPIQAFGGTGPFVLHFRLWSDTEGFLPAGDTAPPTFACDAGSERGDIPVYVERKR